MFPIDDETGSNSSMPIEPPPPPVPTKQPPTPPAAPPPPPVFLPTSMDMHRGKQPPKSLAEIIRENQLKLGKDGTPQKPPRRSRKQEAKRRSREKRSSAANHQSDRILKMGKYLENQGALDPFYTSLGRDNSFYSEEGDPVRYNPRSNSGSRQASPQGRNQSPPRKDSVQKFSYLPDGNLIRPELRHIERGSIRKARAEARRQDPGAKSGPRRKSSFQYKLTASNESKPHPKYPKDRREPEGEENDSVQSEYVKYEYNEDDYNTLKNTLERRLKKQSRLPLPSYKKARQIESSENPPSELEMFFKKRRQKLEDDEKRENAIQQEMTASENPIEE